MTAVGNSENQTKVSVVIPAYNSETTLTECLSALEDQTIPRNRYEVIVVDDGSTDNTPDVARSFHDVLLVQQTNKGPASARNTGASVASSELLLFTDADCVPSKDWIDKMLQPFDDPEVMAVKGSYLTSQPEVIARLIQIEYEEKYDRLSRQQYIDFVDTYSAAYRKQAFVSVGGFDTSFPVPSAEDQELSFRLAKKGYKMVFARGAVVYHQHPSTWLRYVRRKARFGYWRVLVHWKHPKKLAGDSHTLQVQKVQMALAALIVLGLGGFPVTASFTIVAAVSAAAFVVSSLAFMSRTAKKDIALLPYALPFTLARAYGLLAGVISGLLTLPFRMAIGTRKEERSQQKSDPELTLHGPHQH